MSGLTGTSLPTSSVVVPGLFEDMPFSTLREVFCTDNALGNGLHDVLLALVRGGVLDRRGEPDEQFRWRGDEP